MNVSGTPNPAAQTQPSQTAPRNPLSDELINQVKALTKDNQFSREDYKTILTGLKQSGLPEKDIEAVRQIMDSVFNFTDKGFLNNDKLENSEMQVIRKRVDQSGSRAAKQFFNAINSSMNVVENTGMMAGITRSINSLGVGSQDHFKTLVASRNIANFEPNSFQIPEKKEKDEPQVDPTANTTAPEDPQTNPTGQGSQTNPADDNLSLENESDYSYTYRENPVQANMPFVDNSTEERKEDQSGSEN